MIEVEHISDTNHPGETAVSLEKETQEATNNLGKVVLWRVMNLDNHEGVMHRSEDGTIVYEVANQQYPDQGDFAFGSTKSGFQEAANRAFPRHLYNVHAVKVDADKVIEPYPEEAPGLVYIQNGATAVAKRVPAEIINQYTDNPNAAPSDLTRQVRDRLFPLE